MDDARLQEIKARADAATAGPWKASHRHGLLTENDDESAGLGLEIEGPPEAWNRGQFSRGADASFIAHAREDVPDLIAALEASRAECARLRAALEKSRSLALCVVGASEAYGETESAHLWQEVVDFAEEGLYARAALNGAADATVGEP